MWTTGRQVTRGVGRIATACSGSKAVTEGGSVWWQSSEAKRAIAQRQPALQSEARLSILAAEVRHFPSCVVEKAVQQQPHKLMPHCLPSQNHAPAGTTVQSTVPTIKRNAKTTVAARRSISAHSTIISATPRGTRPGKKRREPNGCRMKCQAKQKAGLNRLCLTFLEVL